MTFVVGLVENEERRMKKRRQFVLDDRTNELLDQLAADRAGNLSFVVREAIQLYADMDSRLDQIEQDPAFQSMMKRSEDDIREGRLVSHDEAKKRSRNRKRAT
jgi:predicted transcriptional regulator